MGSILIHSLKQKVRLGWSAEERRWPQLVKIDLKVDLDFSHAINSDALEDTVDYRDIIGCISHVCREREWNLVEKMSGDLSSLLLTSFPAIERVEIQVTKNISELTDGVSVRYVKDR